MRKTCLDCSGGSVKYVAYCPCDGLHSTRCELWPYRFGCRPENVHPRKYVTPEEMPGADVPLEDLPTPAITCRSGRKLTAEQREARLKALRMAQERRAALIKA
jgi:hypothetical protein